MKNKEIKNTEIKGRAIGRNVILEIEGEKFSRAFKSKEDREKVLEDVKKYNNKPTKTLLNALKKVMESPAKTRKQKNEKAEKALKNTKPKAKPKSATTTVSEAEIKQAKELLIKEGFNVSKTTNSPRRGEY